MALEHSPHLPAAVAKAAAWAAIDNWIQQGVGLVSFVVIGSLLGPKLYGLVTLGMIYHLLAASLLRETYGEAIIQRQTIERAHLDTAFWTLLGLGVVLSLLSFVLARPLAALFGETDLVTVISVLGLTFPMLGAANFYRSLLRRRFNMKALAIRSAFAGGLSALLAIMLAVSGFGIWSLLVYQLAFYGLDLLAVAFQSGWWPRLHFSLRHYRDIADFSYKMMGNHILANIGSQIDRFLIGYFIGASAVGLYAMARRIVEGLDQTVLGVINAIALPVFARAQHEHAELRRLLYGMTHFAMLIACPVYGGVGVVAPKLIETLLPQEWHSTGLLLTIMCFSGFFFPALTFLVSSKRAIGRAGLLLGLAVVSMLLRVSFTLGAVFAGFGVIGIVLALGLSNFAMIPIRIFFARRSIGLGTLDYLATMRGPLAATFIMIGVVFGLEHLLTPFLPGLAVLILMIAAGVVTYIGALQLLSPRSVRQIFDLLQSRGRAIPGPENPEPAGR